jgi:hypothetical protein
MADEKKQFTQEQARQLYDVAHVVSPENEMDTTEGLGIYATDWVRIMGADARAAQYEGWLESGFGASSDREVFDEAILKEATGLGQMQLKRKADKLENFDPKSAQLLLTKGTEQDGLVFFHTNDFYTEIQKPRVPFSMTEAHEFAAYRGEQGWNYKFSKAQLMVDAAKAPQPFATEDAQFFLENATLHQKITDSGRSLTYPSGAVVEIDRDVFLQQLGLPASTQDIPNLLAAVVGCVDDETSPPERVTRIWNGQQYSVNQHKQKVLLDRSLLQEQAAVMPEISAQEKTLATALATSGIQVGDTFVVPQDALVEALDKAGLPFVENYGGALLSYDDETKNFTFNAVRLREIAGLQIDSALLDAYSIQETNTVGAPTHHAISRFGAGYD